MSKVKIVKGDYKRILEFVGKDSVDLILIDPPYGTVKGLLMDGWDEDTAKWDVAIEPNKIYAVANKILKQSRKIVIFSQEPYTAELITNGKGNMAFNYRMIWDKCHFANPLAAKKAPLSYYEDMVVLNKLYDTNYDNHARVYFREMRKFIGKSKKEIIDKIGQRADHCFRTESTQFSLPSEETYNDIALEYLLDEWDGFLEYENLFRQGVNSIFNLPKGKSHTSNIWRYKKEGKRYHPTQKPVALLKDLIRTYTNKGDTVVDFFMGSGSTGVACMETGRNFIGVEKDKGYYDIAKRRLTDERNRKKNR